MKFTKIIGIASILFGVLGTTPASAQLEEYGQNILGQQTYMTLCATCHGELAKGDGPLSMLMTDKVSDLTMLSANNDGEFPMLKVIHIIDGRTGLRGHGGPMPVYGELFSAEAAEIYGPLGAEAIVRGRMLSLALYLESIQK